MAKKKNGKTNGHSNGNGQSEFSKRNKSLLGYNSIFTPEVIDDIHIKAVSYTHLTLPTTYTV